MKLGVIKWNAIYFIKMTKEELAIEISILSSKIETLVDLQKKLVDDERYEDAVKVRDYIISIREIMLIYSIMIEEEKKKQIGWNKIDK